MVDKAPVHERRRQHFPPVEGVRLDGATRRVGRQGVARARSELARHDAWRWAPN